MDVHLDWGDDDDSLYEKRMRSMRDKLLAESDWTQTVDAPFTDSKKAEWATYRQTLRDLPANTASPTPSVVAFPDKPTA